MSGFLDEVTPLVITFNEEPNIERTLSKLRWARRVVILDSGSTDNTTSIALSFPNVEIVQNPFSNFADQCNFGLSCCTTEWVLSLDADYVLSDDLVRELGSICPTPGEVAFFARFVYLVHGRRVRASLYPPRAVLHRVSSVYKNLGHGHYVELNGATGELSAPIYHDDRKPLVRWLASQWNYARIEAEHLDGDTDKLTRTDRVRRVGWLAPVLILPYMLILKGAILDGRAGWFYAYQRLLAEVVLSLELLDRTITKAAKS